MNISIIGMPLFYGCDKPGVEKGPEELRKNNLIDIFEKNHNVYDLGDIEVEKRPLLANGKEVLYKLYDERYDLYKEYCDYRVENTGSLEEVVNKIAKVVNR